MSDLKVRSIPVETLIHMMKGMDTGTVIGLAAGIDSDDCGWDWYGIVKIDLGVVDAYDTWVIQYFGGGPAPHILSSYDDGAYLKDDLIKALQDCELLQKNNTVYIDENDLKGVSI